MLSIDLRLVPRRPQILLVVRVEGDLRPAEQRLPDDLLGLDRVEQGGRVVYWKVLKTWIFGKSY